MSLSARRAWIEILYQLYDTYAKVVALRKESVDRNSRVSRHDNLHKVALRKESVDRNNPPVKPTEISPNVALRKESVDRNIDTMQVIIIIVGRSPQGERG